MSKLAIFRIPDSEGEREFVQIKINDGVIEPTGFIFWITNPEDSYLSLGFNQLVIADEIEGGSTNARSITVGEDEEDVAIHELSGSDLQYLVTTALRAFAEEANQ